MLSVAVDAAGGESVRNMIVLQGQNVDVVAAVRVVVVHVAFNVEAAGADVVLTVVVIDLFVVQLL